MSFHQSRKYARTDRTIAHYREVHHPQSWAYQLFYRGCRHHQRDRIPGRSTVVSLTDPLDILCGAEVPAQLMGYKVFYDRVS